MHAASMIVAGLAKRAPERAKNVARLLDEASMDLETLESERDDATMALHSALLSGADFHGAETRLLAIDQALAARHLRLQIELCRLAEPTARIEVCGLRQVSTESQATTAMR